MALTQSGSTRDHWSSRGALLAAAIGSAAGLGNLWRFPAEAAANGGGTFVLFYILCVVLIGLPILLCETLIGRHGQSSAPESVRRVASASRASPVWGLLASIGVLAAFLILSVFCVVGGWLLYYIGLFAGDVMTSGLSGGAFAGQPASHVEGLFPSLIASGGWTLGLAALFLGITLFFVARGVSGGIEVVVNWMVPAFFVLLLAIVLYSAFGGAFGQTLDYLFTFESGQLTGPLMLAAAGQALFSLSLGFAAMITYGSYVGRNVNLAGTSALIAGTNVVVALLAGLCLFPIVFAAGLPAGEGSALMFETLPQALQDMPFGSVVGLLFFVMAFCAALTSSVALLEVPTAWLIDRFRIVRRFSAMIVAFFAMMLVALAALSLGVLADWHPLGFIPLFEGQGVFGALDALTAKVLMPLGAILTAVFVGWVADRKLVDIENGIGGLLHLTWLFLVRFLCPVALAGIVAMGMFPDAFA